MIEGVDYSTSRPNPWALKAAGKHFASRYVGPGGKDKHLTRDEAVALSAAGVAIIANAEQWEDSALGGYAVGVAHALSAHTMAIACGMPPDRPIYFSVDFDVSVGQWNLVAQYFRGVASVIGLERTGIYGGYWAITWAARDKLAKWFWQTRAWSTIDGSIKWHTRSMVQQYQNGVNFQGSDLDLDRATIADFGQWMVNHTERIENVGGIAMGPDGHLYNCQGGWSFPIPATAIGDIVYLSRQGIVSLASGPVGPNEMEWSQDPKHIRDGRSWVRKGWSSEVFGPVHSSGASAGGLTDGDRNLIQSLADAVGALNNRLATP